MQVFDPLTGFLKNTQNIGELRQKDSHSFDFLFAKDLDVIESEAVLLQKKQKKRKLPSNFDDICNWDRDENDIILYKNVKWLYPKQRCQILVGTSVYEKKLNGQKVKVKPYKFGDVVLGRPFLYNMNSELKETHALGIPLGGGQTALVRRAFHHRKPHQYKSVKTMD